MSRDEEKGSFLGPGGSGFREKIVFFLQISDFLLNLAILVVDRYGITGQPASGGITQRDVARGATTERECRVRAGWEKAHES